MYTETLEQLKAQLKAQKTFLNCSVTRTGKPYQVREFLRNCNSTIRRLEAEIRDREEISLYTV